jgi:hypothetical protein
VLTLCFFDISASLIVGAGFNPLGGAQLGTPPWATIMAADIGRLTAAANLRSETLTALAALYRTQATLAGPMIAYGQPWQVGQIANPSAFLAPVQAIGTSI